MGEGGDWWSWPMGVIAEGILRGCQGLFNPVSLGYTPSVFNKNSTLKRLTNWHSMWTGIGGSCLTCEWDMSHMCMSHVWPVNESYLTYVNVPCRVYVFHIHHWRIGTNVDSYWWVMSHVWKSHVSQVNESCLNCEWVRGSESPRLCHSLVSSGRQNWMLDKLEFGDSGVKRVISKCSRCTTYRCTLCRRER